MAKIYDPNAITMTVAGHHVKGFAEGSMLTIKPHADVAEDVVGVDGEYSVSVSADEGGDYEFSLMQTSSSNDVLDALRRTPGFGVYVNDRNGALVQESPAAWIKTLPEQAFGKVAGERKWVIRAEKIVGVIGGSDELVG